MNKIFFGMLVIALFAFVGYSYAQSDYEKTQQFKTKYKELEDAIKNAASLDECNTIGENISKLKNDFAGDKSLLDKSLYPENFESSFAKIERALEVRKGDFTQIVELTTEVGTLKTLVTDLSQKNEELIVKIKELNLKGEKDAATIASLQKLVAQLKANIRQRDMLVRDMVDSLLTQFIKPSTQLSDADKQTLVQKVEGQNLFYNIERIINDNIQFMRVTELTPEDLAEMKEQYRDFNHMWRQIGPKLADVYLNKKGRTTEINNIDSIFSLWSQRLNEEIWEKINDLFRNKQISLLPFNNGDQFTNSAVTFIDDEIKNLGVKSSDESQKTFFAFTDSVWFNSVQPTWVPVLIESRMMTEANKDTIEARIAMWKDKVAPPAEFNWIYVVLIAVIVILLIAYFAKGRKKQTPVVSSQVEPKEQ
ncbi:MAG: hypothetical protein HYS25_03460 [Ignavibacteriales bacterium]|nr:hypothetical protein [Ignavibacteriales bacterium]